MKYSEIDQLTQLQKKFDIRVEPTNKPAIDSFINARFWVNNQYWDIYVDNEYEYFDTEK
jgi:hypothetical protein